MKELLPDEVFAKAEEVLAAVCDQRAADTTR
jgi:hypothetical protein